MRISKWLKKNTRELYGKKIALTGATGGIGKELCRYLLMLGAELILVDRSEKRQSELIDSLCALYPTANIKGIQCDLEYTNQVFRAADILIENKIDVFIHNAGAYSIPRHKCDTGFDNVFQINFLSPYLLIRRILPLLNERAGRVVVVGSIAHNYSVIDLNDADFSRRTRASLVYGNAKRHLMFSLYPLFTGGSASLSVTHPGITLTNITAHYPPLVFALIKHPMRVIFMSPKRAALSILYGVFQQTEKNEWIGPRYFNIWGLPKLSKLKTVDEREAHEIQKRAELFYRNISSSTT